jgi:hypothetical protein
MSPMMPRSADHAANANVHPDAVVEEALAAHAAVDLEAAAEILRTADELSRPASSAAFKALGVREMLATAATRTFLTMRATTVRDVLVKFPETVSVFAAHGLDTCCGAGAPLSQAASKAGLSTDVLVSELEHAVNPVTGRTVNTQ